MGIIIDGSSAAGNINLGSNGTVTNLAVGGLPDGVVDADTLASGAAVPADGSITAAKLAANAVTTAKIADDAVTAAKSTITSNKLLQVVGSSYNTAALINTTTITTTSMYQEITPSKAGSKMLFWCAGHYSQNHNGGQHGPQVGVYIYKKIGSGTDTAIHQFTYDYTAGNNNTYYSHHFAASYFDNTATSNTSDVIRYTIYAKCLYADHQMRFNPSSYTSFVVQEFDA